jgi:hypothetical protein
MLLSGEFVAGYHHHFSPDAKPENIAKLFTNLLTELSPS